MDGSRSRDDKGKGKEKEEENSNEEKGKMILTEEEKKELLEEIRKEMMLEMVHEGQKECNLILGKYCDKDKELHMAIDSYLNRLAQIEPGDHHYHHQLQLQQQEQRAQAILDSGNASLRLIMQRSEKMQQDGAKNGEQVDAEKDQPKK